MSSDTPATTQADSSSLESRITMPSSTETSSEPQAPTTAPEASTTPPEKIEKTEKTESTVEQAQTDGAGAEKHGSELQEPEYDVEVKLSDLQADPNNPLHSVKTFEELGL